MEHLCLVADCAGFTMRWVPADTAQAIEANLPWQAQVFGGTGFVPGAAPLLYLGGRAYLVCEPVPGRSHSNPQPQPPPTPKPATVLQHPYPDAGLCPRAGFLCLIRAAHDAATPGP